MNKTILLASLILVSLFNCARLIAQENNYKEPSLQNTDSWSIIMLPDPQTYVKFGRNQPVFELMTAWITEVSQKLNTQMVVCTGDLVEQNGLLNPDGINGDQLSKRQWEWAAHSFSRLDNKVPYISATGNHDFGVKSVENRYSHYDRYFPIDKNSLNQELLCEVGFDIDGKPSLTNAAYRILTPHGEKLLFLVLEFAPRDTILSWALKTVNDEKYTDYKVILLTHSYLNAENEHIVKESYPIQDANYGEAIWKKLVEPAKNIRLVLSGHIGKPDDIQGHMGFRTDRNAQGKKVIQMMFNAQALGGGWHGNGGDGWLRVLEFLPDINTVSVRTFSPLFAISPSTRHLAWRRESYDEFSFTFD